MAILLRNKEGYQNMKKIIIFLVTLLIFILIVLGINVVNDKDDSLSQPEIETVLEEKE
jgi:preprotein translocase subunit SecG